jgi:NADH pyrophosphatase NudC (nudix superfamily)
VEDLLAREAQEEAGISIESKLNYLSSNAFVRPDGIPAILTKFAVKHKAGEVILNPHDFIDFAWVNGEEAKQYQTISGIPQEVASTIDFFNSLSN